MTDQPLAVIVLSGGLDSTVAAAVYHDQGYRLLCVSVDYGQRHARELRSARAVADYYDAEHVLVDLSSVGRALTGSALTDPTVQVPEGHYAEESMRATVVPNRNAILANVAVGIAVSRQAELVAMGMHAGDHAVYPDCRPEFFAVLNELIRTANEGFNPPRFEAPFILQSKTDIASIGAALGAPMGMTWSCYQGGDLHCGVCGTCYERREAFTDAGVPDPTEYLDSETVFASPS